MLRPETRKVATILSAVTLALISAYYLLGFSTSSFTSTNMGDIQFEPEGSGVGVQGKKSKFETVQGIFLQDDPKTDWATFEYTKQNFGLIPRTYPTDTPPREDPPTNWQRFTKYLHHLLLTSPPNTTYKLLFFGRHGEGFHNVAETKYGTKAWDDYWSKLDGDGELFWADANLTEKGEGQARDAGAFIAAQWEREKMPAPQRYFVSPMYRCLQTAELTYGGLEIPEGGAVFRPMVKELLRETMGEHTCDRRSTRSFIHEKFPAWPIEEDFTEEDELWEKEHRETLEEHDARTTELMEELFETMSEREVFVSLTSHSGAIASHLRVLGHREFRLPTGGMIPVLVKATRVG